MNLEVWNAPSIRNREDNHSWYLKHTKFHRNIVFTPISLVLFDYIIIVIFSIVKCFLLDPPRFAPH